MPTLQKLDPVTSIHLQGMDGYGATAALWGCSETGFTLTGVWGEQDDFAVLILWTADNPQFEHPVMQYLPDTAFDGMTLQFTIALTGCVPIDSTWYPWIDWSTLNVTYADGTAQGVPLLAAATPAAGSYTAATCTFALTGTVTPGDYVELCWLDQHFYYQFQTGDTLATAINAIAYAINSASWTTWPSEVATAAVTGGGTSITLTMTGQPGANGNRVGAYGTVSGSSEAWSPAQQLFSGGVSPSAWTLTFDFSNTAQFNQTAIQQLALAFAPDLQPNNFSGIPSGTPWSVTVTDWAVTDPNNRRPLYVAGPGSVRLEENNPWVVRSGFWEAAPTDGFAYWSQGQAIRAAASGASLTIETHCQSTHNIYAGTRLDDNCGIVQATLDGGAPVSLDCYASSGSQVRRLLFAGVAAGQHSVVITLTGTKNTASSGWYFYFDFLDLAVLSQTPATLPTNSDVGVSIDFDNDYNLSPQRLVWNVQGLSLVGQLDHYMGVFWWPQRAMFTPIAAWQEQVTIVFSGTPTFGQFVTLNLGGTALTHGVQVADTAATIATCFAYIVNQGSTVFWAEASGTTLTLYGRAASSAYHMTVTFDTTGNPGFTAAVTTTDPGAMTPEWGVNAAAGSPVNAAVVAWHQDWFAALKAAGLDVTVSFSDELVNPPDNPPTAVWVQRFPDGTPVTTATGFGTLSSSQCAFGTPMQTYMQAAYAQMAQLLSAAGLTPRLQFGEILWWYFAGGTPSGMAFYDSDTTAAAQTALGRPLHTFLTPADDPSVNGYADANFLANRLLAYVSAIQAYVLSAVPTAVFELLWPKDVDDPITAPLMYYVNLPAAWMTRSGSGFDTFMIEGFGYNGVNHNIDAAVACAEYPYTQLAWDVAHCRYLMGWYYSCWPWQREYLAVLRTPLPLIKTWAFIQLRYFGWPLPLPAPGGSAGWL
jgi:hypothetical protein